MSPAAAIQTTATADVLRGLLADHLCMAADDELLARDDVDLIDTLGMDSLDLIELCIAVEEELAIHIPDDQLARLRTLRDVIECVDACRRIK